MAFYLITGGAGFIGSNLCEELLRRGNKVRIIDDFSTGKEENIQDFLNDIEVVRGDIRDIETVREAMKGVEYVSHQAALSSVPMSIKDPVLNNQVNIDGTLNVLVAARDEGVKRVVIASSAAVYGNGEVLPKVETMVPEPISPYAVSKHVGEQYAKLFYELYGLETVCLRYFNVFGPKQDPSSQYSGVISKFMDAVAKGEAPVIFGDGEQSRDFVYVDNVVEANILASVSERVGHGEVLNIASGKRITLNELVKVVGDVEAVYGEERVGDVRHSLADVGLARELLGYEVEKTLTFILKNSRIGAS